MTTLRSDRLSRFTTLALVVAAASAFVGVLVRGDFGVALDTVALCLLGALPALRVAVLAARWSREGDRRFALAAVALLLLMSLGVVAVAVWR